MRVGLGGEVEESAESLLSGSTVLGGGEFCGEDAEFGTHGTGVLSEVGVVGGMHVGTVCW